MTDKEQLKEKAALEAYPENISYSTLVEQNVDYNGRDREIYKQGFDKGYEVALEKAYDYIKQNWIWNSKMMEEMKKAMEE